jgi:hypothetical protein
VIFRKRQRSAKQAARQIAGLSRHVLEQFEPHHQRLVQTTKAKIRQAERVLAILGQMKVALRQEKCNLFIKADRCCCFDLSFQFFKRKLRLNSEIRWSMKHDIGLLHFW